MRRIRYLFLLSCPALLLMQCSRPIDISGATSETTNGIAGVIKDRNGPIAGVIVTLYPEKFNPVTETVADSLRDVTDCEGNFLFELVNHGIYNLQALHPESRTGALIQGVEVPEAADSVISVPDASLESQGTIMIHIKELAVEENGHVYLPGTGINVQITGSDMSNGMVIVEELPPSAYPAINYTAPGGSSETLPIEEEIDVQPDDTLEIGPLTAPDFTVTDIDGREHHLYEYTSAGNYVLLYWIYEGAGFDTLAYADLNRYYTTYGCNGGGLVVLGIGGYLYNYDQDIIERVIDYDIQFPVASGHAGQGGGHIAVQDFKKGHRWPYFCWITPENELKIWGMEGYTGWETFKPLLPILMNDAGIEERACISDGTFSVRVSRGSGNGRYPAGEAVTLKAEEIDHMRFTGWAGDIGHLEDPAAAQTELIVPEENSTIFANYTPITDGILMPSGACNKVAVRDTLFYDDMGANLKYSKPFQGEITFVPATEGNKIRIEFLEFSILDSNFRTLKDFMSIYDGSSAAAPSLGVFFGDNSPGVLESTANDGSITITWKTNDGWKSESGWKARVTEMGTGGLKRTVFYKSAKGKDRNRAGCDHPNYN